VLKGLPQESPASSKCCRNLAMELRDNMLAANLGGLYQRIRACHKCPAMDKEKELRRIDAIDRRTDTFIISEALAPAQLRLTGVNFFGLNGGPSETGKKLEGFLNSFGRTIYPSREIRLTNGASIRPCGSRLIPVYNTEVAQCFPGREKNGSIRTPTSHEITICHGMGFLAEEIQLIQPRLILLQGAKSRDAFFEHHLRLTYPKNLADHIKLIVGQKRIPQFAVGGSRPYVMPMVHASPAANGAWPVMENDMLIELIRGVLQ
jgi:uracil-DNA glycosylase